jgi:hypothetical protein
MLLTVSNNGSEGISKNVELCINHFPLMHN